MSTHQKYNKYHKDNLSLSFSELNCPFHNLAIENKLLSGDFFGDHHLFIYRNDPCIVMGRFQVPWREVNMPRLLSADNPIILVRRRSGGGTVYHDLGNWNYCFVHKTRDLPRETNLQMIITLLAEVGIKVAANERYDLVHHHDNGTTYKVSGSAFKQKKDTCLHHGTLLMDASLKRLKGHLGLPTGWEFEGKGVKSVPSPVLNLAEISEPLTFEGWVEHIAESLDTDPFIWSHKSFKLDPTLTLERDELMSWSWLWGETPHFTMKFKDDSNKEIELTFQKGICINALLDGENLSEIIGQRVAKKLSIPESKQDLMSKLDTALGHFFFSSFLT